jgi:hypothetical protein
MHAFTNSQNFCVQYISLLTSWRDSYSINSLKEYTKYYFLVSKLALPYPVFDKYLEVWNIFSCKYGHLKG